jgi:hypothetical protein
MLMNTWFLIPGGMRQLKQQNDALLMVIIKE